MNNLIELEKRITSLGWFAGRIKLEILLENEFEGFYGKANENWNSRVSIRLSSTYDPRFFKECIGKQYQNINEVAGEILKWLDEEWFNNKNIIT
jgi:hypothetical protein